MTAGYRHPEYAFSLTEWGQPRLLPHSKGWILERPLPDLPYKDAMGCYPLFTCAAWDGLVEDLDTIGDDLVSLAVVVDPFGKYDEPLLRQAFPDVMQPFKEHFVVDLAQTWPAFVRTRHQRYAQAALEQVQVEICPHPQEQLAEWTSLYQHLITRHHLRGMHRFSPASFAHQLAVPGVLLFRAMAGDELVGMYLWYVQDEVAYAHLIACTPRGYELRAAYALYWFAFSYFFSQPHGRVRWLDIGGSAGIRGDQNDGLSQFKRGWATGVRQAYFCGRIFNQSRYNKIVSGRGLPATSYFPAYRQGEFGYEAIKTD